MGQPALTTTQRIVAAGRRRIVLQGYSGFSFADVAADVGIRKPSIHHHFPGKADLAVAVIAQSRADIEAAAAALGSQTDAEQAIRDYAAYWKRCIADGSDPFCLAGVLAAEMPNLPARVAEAVRAHFAALEDWLAAALAAAAEQGSVCLAVPPRSAAAEFMATVYGAMLVARVFDDPGRFGRIVERLLHDLFSAPPAPSAVRPDASGPDGVEHDAAHH